MQAINVVKHNGTLEPLDLTKPTASLEWATAGISGVSVSDIMMQSKLHFFDGITTSYITDIFIKTCDDLADLRNVNYDKVARNLKLQKLYKHVFNSITPPSLVEFLEDRINDGHYSSNLLNQPGVDYEALEAVIDHSRDFTFTSSIMTSRSIWRNSPACSYRTGSILIVPSYERS